MCFKFFFVFLMSRVFEKQGREEGRIVERKVLKLDIQMWCVERKIAFYMREWRDARIVERDQ